LAAFAFFVAARADQGERARTEALAQRAGERLQALQREADRLASEERTLLNELRKLEIDRQLKAEELKQVVGDSEKVQHDLDAITARIESLEAAEAKAHPALSARLVEIYKLGQARYVRLLLSAPDLRRVGQASRTVAVLAKMDRDRVLAHQQTIRELQATRATLEERHRQLAAVRVRVEQAQAAADRAARARAELVRDIDQRRDLTAQLAGELQATQQKLQLALRGAESGGGATTLPLKPFQGDLDWPVVGTVQRPFARARFKGIEILAAEGSTARAVHDGVVAFADTFSGFGNLVILDHGSQNFSLYGELLAIAVAKGAHVERGQPVGLVGPTPRGTTGLYFELRIDGQPVDPLQWLKKR
jgi:septal ring factor EnvC (AmiA/AmiB activator)